MRWLLSFLIIYDNISLYCNIPTFTMCTVYGIYSYLCLMDLVISPGLFHQSHNTSISHSVLLALSQNRRDEDHKSLRRHGTKDGFLNNILHLVTVLAWMSHWASEITFWWTELITMIESYYLICTIWCHDILPMLLVSCWLSEPGHQGYVRIYFCLQQLLALVTIDDVEVL